MAGMQWEGITCILKMVSKKDTSYKFRKAK